MKKYCVITLLMIGFFIKTSLSISLDDLRRYHQEAVKLKSEETIRHRDWALMWFKKWEFTKINYKDFTVIKVFFNKEAQIPCYLFIPSCKIESGITSMDTACEALSTKETSRWGFLGRSETISTVGFIDDQKKILTTTFHPDKTKYLTVYGVAATAAAYLVYKQLNK